VDFIQWLGDENANNVYEKITSGQFFDNNVEYSYLEKDEF
jgi:hypothetical protein